MKSKFTILIVCAALAESTLALDKNALLEDFSGLKADRQCFLNNFQTNFNSYYDIIDLLREHRGKNGKYDCETVAKVEAVKKAQIAAFEKANDVYRTTLARIGMNIAATRPDPAIYVQLRDLIKLFHKMVDKLLYGTGYVSIEEIDQTKEEAASQLTVIWQNIFKLTMESLDPNDEEVNAVIANLQPRSTASALIAINAAYTAFKLYVIEISGQIHPGRVDFSSAINNQRSITINAINDEVNTKFTLLDYIATAFATGSNQILSDFEAIDDGKWVTIGGFQQALQALYPVLVDLAEKKNISASLEALYENFVDGEKVAFFGTLQAISYTQPNGSARVVIDIAKRNKELEEFAAALVDALRSAQEGTRNSEKRAKIEEYETLAEAKLLSFWKALYEVLQRAASEVNDDLRPVIKDAGRKAYVNVANVVAAIFDVITVLGTQNSSRIQNNSEANLIVLENTYGIISSNLTEEAWRKFTLILIIRLSVTLQDNGVTDFLPLLLPLTKQTSSCS